jgi:hypothetical protein
MKTSKLPALIVMLGIATCAQGSNLLVRMTENTSRGSNQPPLFSTANFSFAVFKPSSSSDKNAWQLGPLSASDVGHTFSLTSENAASYSVDWDRLQHDLTSGAGGYDVWLGYGPPTKPVDGYGGLEMDQLFRGYHEYPQFTGDAYVPSLNGGVDFAGYYFDRFDLTLNSLGFHQASGFYWIDVNYEVNMFGDPVPEPTAASLCFLGTVFAAAGKNLRRRSCLRQD